jgi:hypothetical protein
MISCFKQSIENMTDKEWLVIGKGPSFSSLENQDLSSFVTISLNHVIELIQVDYAHFVDFDAFLDCQEYALKNAKYVILPFYPHINNSPGTKKLSELSEENETLSQLKKDKRLLSYDLVSSKKRNSDLVFVDGLFFSGEVVIKLLAGSGVKNILIAGIDGGNTYNNQFSHLNSKTLLANQRSSFNIQFREISKTIIKYKLRLNHFNDRRSTFKVFVGAEEGQELAFKVLEYSIQINCPATVEVINLGEELHKNKDYLEAKNLSKTPFSFQRFAIPQLCNYQGIALYLDSDMLVLNDIRELFKFISKSSTGIATVLPTEGRDAQNSVFVIDTSKVRWNLKNKINDVQKNTLSYKDLLKTLGMPAIDRIIPSEWNSLEKLTKDTCLIHYTDMPIQPWIDSRNKNQRIWLTYLDQAIKIGLISYDELKTGMRAQFIRPSLIWDIGNDWKTYLPYPFKKIRDYKFIPPYKELLFKK